MKILKKAVIIGYGSIGQRHAKILFDLKLFEKKIYIVTKQKISSKYQKLNSLKELNKINPDYFLICSETFKHYNQLKYLVENFKKKLFLLKNLYLKKVINLN